MKITHYLLFLLAVLSVTSALSAELPKLGSNQIIWGGQDLILVTNGGTFTIGERTPLGRQSFQERRYQMKAIQLPTQYQMETIQLPTQYYIDARKVSESEFHRFNGSIRNGVGLSLIDTHYTAPSIALK